MWYKKWMCAIQCVVVDKPPNASTKNKTNLNKICGFVVEWGGNVGQKHEENSDWLKDCMKNRMCVCVWVRLENREDESKAKSRIVCMMCKKIFAFFWPNNDNLSVYDAVLKWFILTETMCHWRCRAQRKTSSLW